MFGLQREQSESEIREILGEKQVGQLKRKQLSASAETLSCIMEYLDIINDAIYYLTNKERRIKYDKKLEQMYRDGMINNNTESKNRNNLAQAEKFYKEGSYSKAIFFADKAIQGDIKNKDAYILLINCYYETSDYSKAIEVLEKTLNIYSDDAELIFLAAHIYILCDDFENAQKKIDRLYTLNANKSSVISEQYFLDLNEAFQGKKFDVNKGGKVLANIKSYIQANPEDNEFKKKTAYNMLGMTSSYYTQDKDAGTMYINSQEDFLKLKTMSEKAARIYDDNSMRLNFEKVRELGKIKYNSDNSDELKTLTVTGALVLIASACIMEINPIIAIFMVAVFVSPCVVLWRLSLKPKWEIDKIRYRGYTDRLENTLIKTGQVLSIITKWSWKLTSKVFRFIINIATRIF